jgi:diguanylate cyclase
MADAAHGGRCEAAGGLGFLRHLFGERAAVEPAVPAVGDPIAEATLLALRHHGIRPTPEAYTLWYRHLAGERPDLTRRLKELEARGERFDAVLIAELFERYFGVEREVLKVCEASGAIEQLLAALAGELHRAGTDAAARGDRLERLGLALDARGGHAACPAAPATPAGPATAGGRRLPQLLLQSIAEILKETAGMRTAAYRLQRRVVESAGEIAQLRATIEAAGVAAELDPVSGVGTAKLLRRALRREAMRAVGRRAPGDPETGEAAADAAPPPAVGFCVIVVDLDRFADFNKTHGRRLGDLVLRATAQGLARAIKRGDTIARLDGAAFGIVLAQTDLAGAEALAGQLRRIDTRPPLAEAAAEAPPSAGALVPPTLSIGVAAYQPNEPLERLLGRAERARQLAKEAGGDRVISERTVRVVGRPKA